MRRNYRQVLIGIALCGLFSISLSKGAQAFEGVAGWEGDATPLGYAFLTTGFDLPMSSNSAIAVRITGSYLYYDLSDADSVTQVRAPGASLVIGPKFTLGSVSISTLAGLEHRWTSRESTFSLPRFRTSTATEEEQDFAVAGHGLIYANLSKFNSGMLLISYEGGNKYAFSRLMLKRQISNTSFASPTTFFAGFDATFQGNQEIRTAQLGLLVEVSLMQGHLSFGLRGGAKRSWLSSEITEDGLYFGTNLFTHW